MSTITNESEEMYLETIYMISKENIPVRSIEVANRLGYAKSSVTVGMKNLLDYKESHQLFWRPSSRWQFQMAEPPIGWS